MKIDFTPQTNTNALNLSTYQPINLSTTNQPILLYNMKFAFTKINFILMGVAFAVIVAGFVLMHGSSTVVEFNPDVFSFRRVTLAPIVCMVGFVLMIVAILWKPKKRDE